MKRLLCLLMCAALPLWLMTACGDDSSSSADETDIAMENMPYGSTLREVNAGQMTVCFDYRYFSDEAMKKLGDYFIAVQAADEKLFESTQDGCYLDYIKKNSDMEVKALIDDIRSSDVSELGKKFKYTYIEVTNAGDSSVDDEIDEIETMMDGIYKDAGKPGDFKSTVKDAKFASLSITAEADGKSYTNTAHTVYVFECEDGIYIFN